MKHYLSTLLLIAGLMAGTQSLAVEAGAQAPDFTLPALQEGKSPVALEDYRGKVVYVDFWASWCAPCLRSLPQINTLYNTYRDRGFEVIAINVDNPVEDGLEFLLDVDLDYVTPADTDNRVLETYAVQAMPTSFLIDPEGVVRKVHMGFREGDADLLEEELLKLLAESGL